jgi:hypothetical protein
MKKKSIFVIVVIFSLSINLYAQKEAPICKGKRYKGYVFDTSYIILKSIIEQRSKASLSCDEIRIAERILKDELPNLNSTKINQSKGCPNISKKLSKYCRQYFGFINNKGEKIIWMNMFWNRDLNDKAKYGLINVNDGCSYFWNIEVNITTKTLSNLQINGNG